ncbi:RNA-directed DNA polymerase [Periweissella cryptocerci]|uniref:RNA-directed DNA polymerase n=1 Tax=Periweissella cryptocerci TaxID=2506420 RepID=A0A4P6YWX5_9LACO|nr:RNA-directed DNA polymerase [Periweissella cryptocerci]QBO37293.1 RNA-directed DNA polymerase [Periweissella cryptocerci]
MKRANNLWPQIISPTNIDIALTQAARHKTHRRDVQSCIKSRDVLTRQLAIDLKRGNFTPCQPKEMIIFDGPTGKQRTILKPRFYPDQLVHQLLITAIEPSLMRGMYQYSCGSIPKRGASYGQKAVRKWLDNDPRNTKYCLKMDVSKFYPSIDNENLKRKFRTIIKDKKVLWLIDRIVDTQQGQAIGYYTSQWFANFYLQDFDHYVKEKLGAKYYVRYVDDLVILGQNKKTLHKMRERITAYLANEGLTTKPNWQVFKIAKLTPSGTHFKRGQTPNEYRGRAIDFLGLKFYRDNTTLRRKNVLRIKRRVKKINRKGELNFHDACAIVSYHGWMTRSNSKHLYITHIKPVVTIGEAKRRIRHESLRKNRE